MDMIAYNTEVIGAIHQYLVTRPHTEVDGLVQALKLGTPVPKLAAQEPTPVAQEAPKAPAAPKQEPANNKK